MTSNIAVKNSAIGRSRFHISAWRLAIPDISSWFFKVPLGKFRNCPQMSPRPFSSTSFAIQNSLIILPFDTTQSEPRTDLSALLSKWKDMVGRVITVNNTTRSF